MSNLSCPFPKSSQNTIKEYIVVCCLSQRNYICIPSIAIYIIKTIRQNLSATIFMIQIPFSVVNVMMRFARQQLVLLKSTSHHSATSWRKLALIIWGTKIISAWRGFPITTFSLTDTKISNTLNRCTQPLLLRPEATDECHSAPWCQERVMLPRCTNRHTK